MRLHTKRVVPLSKRARRVFRDVQSFYFGTLYRILKQATAYVYLIGATAINSALARSHFVGAFRMPELTITRILRKGHRDRWNFTGTTNELRNRQRGTLETPQLYGVSSDWPLLSRCGALVLLANYPRFY